MKRGAFAQSRQISGAYGDRPTLRSTVSYREPGSTQFHQHGRRDQRSETSDSDSDLDYEINSSPDMPNPPPIARNAAPGSHGGRPKYHVQDLRNPGSVRSHATEDDDPPYVDEPPPGDNLLDLPDEPEDLVGLTVCVGWAVGFWFGDLRTWSSAV